MDVKFILCRKNTNEQHNIYHHRDDRALIIVFVLCNYNSGVLLILFWGKKHANVSELQLGIFFKMWAVSLEKQNQMVPWQIILLVPVILALEI